MPDALLLLTVPGIGILTATALIAFVGDPWRFRSGRHFAAYLGLTPREHSTGQVRRMGPISKHGNTYVRMLLVHGARSALRAGTVSQHPDDLRMWARAVAARKGHNVAAVALANKLARVCWRVWHEQQPFERREAR
jgi:transposase